MFPKHQSILRGWLIASIFLFSVTTLFGEAYEEVGKKHSWFSFSKPAKSTAADQMAHARSLLKQKKDKKARKAFRSLVITWPSSKEAPAAQWAYAKLLEKQGKTIKAFDAYQLLMEDYPGLFPNYDEILSRQFEIAKEVMTKRKAKFFILPGFEAPERAIPYFEKVIKNGPRSPFAPEAQYLIGDAYEKSFQYELAVVAYITTLHRYPLSPFAEEAAFGRARALYKITKEYPNDTQALDEAWAGVLVFLRAFPDSGYAGEAQTMREQLLDQKSSALFNVASFYDLKAKRPTAARESYEQFVQQFPTSERAKIARKRIDVLATKIDQPKDQEIDE